MLRSRAKRDLGFTMIELIVTITIFALLVALTVPTMRQWVVNTKVRAVADTLQNGIRLAQAEAQRRSRQTVFALTNTAAPAPNFAATTPGTPGTYWAVQTVPLMTDGTETPTLIASGLLTSSGTTVQITAGTQNQTAICFNSLGRLVANPNPGPVNATCTTPTTAAVNTNSQPMFTYIVSAAGADRTLQVEVAMGGQLHLCDTKQSSLASGNPYGC